MLSSVARGVLSGVVKGTNRIPQGSKGLTLHLRLALPRFILQNKPFQLLPLSLALLLVGLEVDGDGRIEWNVQCAHLESALAFPHFPQLPSTRS